MKPKMRLVSVRLSQDEYERLKSLSSRQAGGTVSGLIRSSMHGIMLNGNRTLIDLLSEPIGESSGADLLTQLSAIQVLERRLENLDREVKRLGGSSGTS
jgi:hypothetical protein